MSAPPRGRFITLEGGEGAGKSTNLRVIEKLLKSRAVPFVSTREPGGTELAEALRSLLLNPASEIAPLSELLMVFAARFDHVENVIVPALREGTWVICDRFVDASFAYQGGGRELPWSKIETLERWLPRLARPDLVLLLDVAPGRGLTRATRNRTADRFERERAAFYQRVRKAYLRRARGNSRYRVINAGRSRRAVAADVSAAVNGILDRFGGAQ
ncbi:MAG: dTMP kinase [Pseudomonadota bacterium]